MKFACLVYVDKDIADALSPAEGEKLKDDSIAFDWSLRNADQLILAQPLKSPETAVTIRSRSGRLSRTDGPFAETKEFLGGFFLIEARDLDEAIRIVESDPMTEMGSIEIRPFLDQTHSVTGQGRPPLETSRQE